MSLAQKFRGFVASKPAIALTSLLTLSSLLPFTNATAQEPRATTVSNPTVATAPDLQKRIDESNRNITRMIEEYKDLAVKYRQMAKGPTIDQVDKYSKENRVISLLFLIGPKDSEEAANTVGDIVTFFKEKGITVEIFPDKSPKEVSAVSYSVDGKHTKAYILKQSDSGTSPPGAEAAYAEFKRVHGDTAKAPATSRPAVAAASPVLIQQ